MEHRAWGMENQPFDRLRASWQRAAGGRQRVLGTMHQGVSCPWSVAKVVIPESAGGGCPEARKKCIWIPDLGFASSGMTIVGKGMLT